VVYGESGNYSFASHDTTYRAPGGTGTSLSGSIGSNDTASGFSATATYAYRGGHRLIQARLTRPGVDK
jgi:hypothetical protein